MLTQSFVNCKALLTKKQESQYNNEVLSKNWEIVAVDLYGLMPSSNHVVVVQDLGSRYPAAKLISSTRAESIIPALKDIYNNYGRPETQISDNGPPFNSKKMTEFAAQNNTELQKNCSAPPIIKSCRNFDETSGEGNENSS